MARKPNDYLNTLFDRVLRQASEDKKPQRQDKGPKRKTKRKAPKSAAAKRKPRPALTDGLTFRIGSRPGGLQSFTLPDSGSAAPNNALEVKFRSAFLRVWAGMPERDRCAMLDYWRDPRNWTWSADFSDRRRPRPLIRILDERCWGSDDQPCDDFGHKLNFPIEAVVGPTDDLVRLIGRTLAEVQRDVTGRHPGLLVKMLLDPLDQWEAQMGKKATEEKCEAEWDRLEQSYLHVYESDIADILRSWGIDPTVPSAR